MKKFTTTALFSFGKNVFPFLALFLFALWYRFSRLDAPFWVDEFSTVAQAKLFLRYGWRVFHDATQYVEYHNILPHLLVAGSFRWLGEGEFAARLPFMITGALVPVSLYALVQKSFGRYTAFLTGVLAATSYFLITWSRQARGYMLQELLAFVAFILYFQLTTQKKSSFWLKIAFGVSLFLGMLTHTMFVLVIAALAIHYLLFYFRSVRVLITKPWVWGILLLGAISGLVTGQFSTIANYLSLFLQTGLSNNVWYYHAFLWREYALVTFLGTVGLGIAFFTHRKMTTLFLIHAFLQLFFVCFIMGPYVSRYILFIFTYLLIGMAYTLTYFTDLIKKQHPFFLSIVNH
jgi:4-amino-4-deoxy-L-arabinose transferase-like glycosyltransferase